MMKRNIQRLASILVSVIIIITSLVAVCGIPANAQNTVEQSNLLKGLIPITFTGSDVGNNHYNWQEIRTNKVGNADSTSKMGYDVRNNQGLSGKDSWIPYTTKLTDGNTDTKQWIEPLTDGNDFVITYELENPANVQGFSIKTTGADSAHQSKTVKVYMAPTYEELFGRLIDTYVTDKNDVEAVLSTVNTRYISFVFSNPEWYATEIEIYGEETAPNILKGAIPITFTGTDNDLHYNWVGIFEDSGVFNNTSGYDIYVNENMSAREGFWLPYTTKLTDGTVLTKQWIQQGHQEKNFIITYDLGECYNLERFSINTQSTKEKSVKVYASENYSDLFTSMIDNGGATTSAAISRDISAVNVRYVAFILTAPGYYVTEIELFGEKTAPNAVSGLIPITYTGSEVGNNHYDWSQVARYHASENGGAGEQWYGGFDQRKNEGMSGRLGVWKDLLCKMTDGNTATKQWVEPMNSGRDFVITYELESSTNIQAFSIKTLNAVNASKTVKVYAGSDYTELFTNLIGTYNTAENNIEANVTCLNTKYIMFVFTYPELYISEIEVYGEDTYSVGDANCDGAINATDMAHLRYIVLEKATTIEKRTADVNDDTYINIRDLVALRAKLALAQ